MRPTSPIEFVARDGDQSRKRTRNENQPSLLANISVADSSPITKAWDLAKDRSDPYLFNHSVRSWLFAVQIAQRMEQIFDEEVVAIGCLLHDIGLTKGFDGPNRFEVEGANAARSFVRELGFDDRRAQLVWDSVALNSTPSIGLHKENEVALCTVGIGLDFAGRGYEHIPAETASSILGAFPRLAMKHEFTKCIFHLVRTRPETTYDNFTRDFGERFVPGYSAVSVVDLLMNSPFEE
jgi:hypothetical protein